MEHYIDITKEDFYSFKSKDSIILNTPFDRSISEGDYVLFREKIDGVITKSHPIKTLVKSVITKKTLFYKKTWIIELEKCKDESEMIQTLKIINDLELKPGLHFLIENKFDKDIFEVFINDIQGDFIKFSRTLSKHSLFYPNGVFWKRIEDFKKELSEYNIVHIIK